MVTRIRPDVRSGFLLTTVFCVALAADAGDAGAGTVTGTLTWRGTPVANTQVAAYQSDGGFVRGATTASDGTYSLAGLAAGSYKIRLNFYNREFTELWYRDRGSFETADPVAVPAAGVVEGIDGELRRKGIISGRVTSEGAPVSGLGVAARGGRPGRPLSLRVGADRRRRELLGHRPDPGEVQGRVRPGRAAAPGAVVSGEIQLPLCRRRRDLVETETSGIDADLVLPRQDRRQGHRERLARRGHLGHRPFL